MKNFDKQTLKDKAQGRWLDILPAIDLTLAEAANNCGKHVPCPKGTGTKDGFRFEESSADDGHAFTNSGEPLGDGIEVLMWLNHWSFPETLNTIGEYLGLSATNNAHSTSFKKDSQLKISNAPNTIWDQSSSSPSEPAKKYAINRTLNPKLLVNSSLRYHSKLKHYAKESGETYCPSIVASVTDENGTLLGIQKHYLNEKGGKANVTPNKMMKGVYKGSMSGGAVRLGVAGKALAVTEGVENGLAVMTAIDNKMAVWAGTTGAMLAAMKIPNDVEKVYIFADKDKSGAGEKYAKTLEKRLISEGKIVYLLMPPIKIPAEKKGVDWNDQLTKSGTNAFYEAIKTATPLPKKAKGQTITDAVEGPLLTRVEEMNKTHAFTVMGSKAAITPCVKIVFALSKFYIRGKKRLT